MKDFMDKEFLLDTPTARKIYHEFAENQPIFDYHCHLIPSEIAGDIRFNNISEVWLGNRTFGDHYKWRAIRANGFAIEDISDPWDRFKAWAETMEVAIGNPLYHWTHLELQRYFGITAPLCLKNARSIYDECNRQLKENKDLSVFGIFDKFNVYAVGTTDDPADSLEYHIQVKDKTKTKVIPSFRPDKAINIDAEGFVEYIKKLASASGVDIKNAEDVVKALVKRLDFFVSNGCLATDHALMDAPYAPASVCEVNSVFEKAMNGGTLSPEEGEKYRFFVLKNLGEAYAKRNLVMQLHFAAIRNNNKRKFMELGADTGYDATFNSISSAKLSAFLNSMEEDNALPKTVLYSLNPNDYYVLATQMGCFQSGIPGKIQLGSAWWFCDHKDGMEEQMKTLGNLGLLGRFIGMLTDSRSFLSYPRFEYFRRILCNMVGNWAENGEIPNDMELLGKLIKDISFDNARRYFENGKI